MLSNQSFGGMQNDIHEMVEALSAALDAKHSYTCGHSDRVADLAVAIGRMLGLSENSLYDVHVAGHLHDIGKMGIHDAVLTKPSKLTPEEYEIIKEHPVIGDQILSRIRILRKFARIVRHHHERYDGQGYPDGLKHNSIPLEARIICLADAYDAMTSIRSYRPSIKHGEALEEIVKCSGTQFDPMVVAAFCKLNKAVKRHK